MLLAWRRWVLRIGPRGSSSLGRSTRARRLRLGLGLWELGFLVLGVLGTGTQSGCGCRLGLGQDCGLWTDESGGDDGVDVRTLGKGVV